MPPQLGFREKAACPMVDSSKHQGAPMFTRQIPAGLLALLLSLAAQRASAQCWPDTGKFSAEELTACFMAEFRRCEEIVPNFRAAASNGMGKMTSDPRYKSIMKSKDFDRLKEEAYRNLLATKWEAGGSCKATLEYLQAGKF